MQEKRNSIHSNELKKFIKSTERFLDDTFKHFNFNQLNFDNFDLRNMFHKSIPIRFNETRTHYLIEADLPGFSNEEVQLIRLKQKLKITAQKRKEPSEKLERVLTFPHTIQDKDIKAKLSHGLLNITVKKRQRTGRPVRIETEGRYNLSCKRKEM